MSDILARQRQLIGTTAQWAANDLVIGDGEFAVERLVDGSIKLKIGDGESLFSELSYVSTSAFGDGYTWRAAASLVTGATRTSPNHPIEVAAVAQHSSSNGMCTISVDGIIVAVTNNGGNGEMVASLSVIVPPLTDYIISWSALTDLDVSELRAD